MNYDDMNYEMKKEKLLDKRKELLQKYNELKSMVREQSEITKSIVSEDFSETQWLDWQKTLNTDEMLKAARIARTIPVIEHPESTTALSELVSIINISNDKPVQKSL